jgi:hypothetical protein
LGCSVEFAPQHSTLSARASLCGINFNRLHERKIDHQSIIAHRCIGTTVSTAPHCDENTMFAGKAHCRHDVRFVGAKCHQSRPTIDPSIPDSSPATRAAHENAYGGPQLHQKEAFASSFFALFVGYN